MKLPYTKKSYTAEKAMNFFRDIGLSLDNNLIEIFKEQYNEVYNEHYDPSFPAPWNFMRSTGLVYAILMAPKNDEESVINIAREVFKRANEKGYYKKLIKEEVVANLLYFQRN